MIIYKDILHKLKDAGYNTGRIRSEKIFPESTLQRFRNGTAISTDTLDKICNLTGLKVEDIIEHIPDEKRC